jgi:hypothetical protein
MTKKYYILIDEDRHRDDLHFLYFDKEKAIKEALRRVKQGTKGWTTHIQGETRKGVTIDEIHDDTMDVWSWCDGSYRIAVYECEEGR